MTPADAIADYIVTALSSAAALSGVPVIRQTDESIDRSQSIVVVDCADQGDHDGIPGHVLVDLRASVGVWEHTTDAQGLSSMSTLRDAVRDVLEALPWGDVTAVDSDWIIRHIGGWSESSTTLEGNDRRIQLDAAILVQSASLE